LKIGLLRPSLDKTPSFYYHHCKDYVLAGLETSYSLITKLALYTSCVYENKHHAFTSALTISIRVCVASPSPSLSCFLFSSLLLLSTLPLGSKSITRYTMTLLCHPVRPSLVFPPPPPSSFRSHSTEWTDLEPIFFSLCHRYQR